MFSDPLMIKYMLLPIIAIWGVLAIFTQGRRIPTFILGTVIFLSIVYMALGTGFSIRIPYLHGKMEVVVYTVYQKRVHALAHPLNQPGEPMHIVFSIDPDTPKGAQMRKSFYEAVRAREERAHKSNIIVDMRGYMTEQGEYKYEVVPSFPPKG